VKTPKSHPRQWVDGSEFSPSLFMLETICRPTFLHSSVAPFVLAALSVLCLLHTPVNLPADDNLVVSTTGGKIRGVSRPSGGAEFLGIPFAQKPIRRLRRLQRRNGLPERFLLRRLTA
jgi:hypothetical protein